MCLSPGSASTEIVVSFPYLGEALGIVGPTTSTISHVSKCFSVDDYVMALISELRYRSQQHVWQQREVRSVRFAGGSSWLVCPDNLTRIISFIDGFYRVSPQAEVIVEVDPVHVNKGTVEQLVRGGVTLLILRTVPQRLRSDLNVWGEMYVRRLLTLINLIKKVSGNKFGIDLFFGQSSLNHDVLLKSLRGYVSQWPFLFRCRSSIEGVSKRAHAEVIEEAVHQRQLIRTELESFDYVEEESGLFSSMPMLPGASLQTLGIGAAAKSRYISFGGQHFRHVNWQKPNEYVSSALRCGQAVHLQEELFEESLLQELIEHKLLSRSGLDLAEVRERYQISFEPRFVELLVQAGYLRLNQRRIRISDKGSLVIKNIVKSFMDEYKDYKNPERSALFG